jgi:hypothetical protein
MKCALAALANFSGELTFSFYFLYHSDQPAVYKFLIMHNSNEQKKLLLRIHLRWLSLFTVCVFPLERFCFIQQQQKMNINKKIIHKPTALRCGCVCEVFLLLQRQFFILFVVGTAAKKDANPQ